MKNAFLEAKPIWAKGRELEKNLTCGFKAVFDWDGNEEAVFRVAASSTYRFFINGQFAGAGPARGPHGFYRVDEWKILTESFGPQRKKTGVYPDIYPSNAFIGNYLRLDILSRYGLKEKVLAEMEGYFTYMVEKTGTLWEHDGDFASCNHGFASYAAYLLLKDSSDK